MRILDRYIGRQILATTISGVIVLSLVLVLGQLFKEIRPLLDSGSPPSIVFEFVLQVIPFSLMFTMPWGFLTAVLLVFGRLSADNEFTSMRMAGLGLWRISAPAFLLAFLFSGLCYWINIEVSPRAKGTIGELLIKAATNNPKALFRSGQPITRFSGVQVLVDKRVDDTIYGLHLYLKPNADSGSRVLHAEKADIEFDEKNKELTLQMHNVFAEDRGKTQTNGKQSDRQAALIEDMPYVFAMGEMSKPKRKASRFTNDELDQELKNPNLPMKERTQFETEKTRRLTFSLACLIFAFIGVPLAIQTRRKDTSSGFAYGIAIAALYFVALIFADLSRENETILPHILLWMPNVLGVIVGVYFFRRTRLQA